MVEYNHNSGLKLDYPLWALGSQLRLGRGLNPTPSITSSQNETVPRSGKNQLKCTVCSYVAFSD